MNKRQSIGVIIAAAGSGTRMGGVLKQHIPIRGTPMALMASKAFLQCEDIECLVYVGEDEERFCRSAFGYPDKDVRFAPGGKRRQDSVQNGLRQLPEHIDIVLVHDGARPYVSSAIIRRVVEGCAQSGAAVPCVRPVSTIRTETKTLDRSTLYEVQTPQGFSRILLERGFTEAEALGLEVTDEASLMELIGVEVQLVEGSRKNIKVTTQEDVSVKVRMGIGTDVHRLVCGRPLWLGLVHIPHDRGLAGHSDADVLAHAIADALLGAAALGDIGMHFPSGEARWKDVSGKEILLRTASILRSAGFTISSIDATLSCEQPRLSPYREAMRERIASALEIDPSCVSVKATTHEGMGFVGREEGISAIACAVVGESARAQLCNLQSKLTEK